MCIAAGLSKLAGVDASEDKVNAAVASTVPLGKVGAKWDIAIAAVFLCSSAARHLTGAVTAPAKLGMGIAGEIAGKVSMPAVAKQSNSWRVVERHAHDQEGVPDRLGQAFRTLKLALSLLCCWMHIVIHAQGIHWWWTGLHGCGGSQWCRGRWSARHPGAWKPKAAPWAWPRHSAATCKQQT